MGQTLTHGVYLPDEGERNCYNGLAGNWQLLDGAVGTIAEHTSALAGKAPLVHTHGKSDITDLFNSANIWSENNTFSKQVCLTKVNDTSLKSQNSRAELGETNLSGDTYTQFSFEDKNGDNFGYLRQVYGADGNNGFHFFVRNKFLNGVPNTTGTVDYSYFGLRLNPDKSKEAVFKASLRPYDSTFAYNLGDATYQWNNLYAKGYYYNGVAWGLDKANVWSGNNIFNKNVGPASVTSVTDTTLAFNGLFNTIFLNTRGSSNRRSYGSFLFAGYGTASGVDNYGQIQLLRSTDKRGDTDEGYIPDTSFKMWRVAPHSLIMDSMEAVRVTNDGTENSLKPITNNATDLGTSDNKWKTLNGINPGALSLPDTLGTSGTENVNYFNVIGYLNNTGTLTTIPSTATYDGWLYINAKDGADSYIIIDDSPASFGASVYGNNGLGSSSVGLLCLICPIRAGHSYNVRVKSAGIVSARIYPAQGNV